MLRVLLIYDIVDDRARSQVADACLDYGLDRIQYSAFCGRLSRGLQEELMLRISTLIKARDSAATVQLFPIDEATWKKRMEWSDAG
jgi:CRISPR-associated protein Cas2